jgi:nicotinate-nucleotide adenylyltransferase
MTADVRLGILGGTFDPIHLGHLETARAARRALALDRVVLVPSRLPPHRPDEPVASAFHRFAMAALCASECDWLRVSDHELLAPGPSFTARTLDHLRESGLRSSQLFFITGADAFAEIETWHRYPEVLDLAHFAVVSRPGTSVQALTGRLPGLQQRFGDVAARLADDGSQRIFLIDAATPDISATDIRRRLARGAPITGLLCPAVERHILRHLLYRHVALGDSLRAANLHGKD